MNNDKSTVEVIAGCLVAIGLWVGLGLLSAWLLMMAWNLLVPAFHGPIITYTAACGLYFILTMVCGIFKPLGKS
jgi:hypothetical protein